MWYLLKDSGGNKSISYTMVVVTFSICTLWLFLSTFEQIGGWHIREFSAEEASLWFAPLASLYFGRRWTKAQEGAKGVAANLVGGGGGGNSGAGGGGNSLPPPVSGE